jgi:hypothetical protein
MVARKQREREKRGRKGRGSQYTFQWHIPSDLLPSTRPPSPTGSTTSQ